VLIRPDRHVRFAYLIHCTVLVCRTPRLTCVSVRSLLVVGNCIRLFPPTLGCQRAHFEVDERSVAHWAPLLFCDANQPTTHVWNPRPHHWSSPLVKNSSPVIVDRRVKGQTLPETAKHPPRRLPDSSTQPLQAHNPHTNQS
jgi:hypothetical protein